jgi:hypothetical protein
MPPKSPDADVDAWGLPDRSPATALATVTSDRGVADPGLIPPNPRAEDIAAADDETELKLGCDRLPDFGINDELPDREIKRLVAMSALHYLPGLDCTPCLFKMARAISNNLLAVARRQPKTYVQLLARLIDMRAVLKERVERPYKLAFDSRLRQPLPQDALEYWPFSDYESWVEDLRAYQKGRATVMEPIPIVDKRDSLKADDSQQAALEASMLILEKTLTGIALGNRLDDTPLVKQAVITLSALTLKTIERQTGVRINPGFDDVKLIKSTEVIFYHSVFSVVLDAQGEPSTLGGLLDYPILVSPPGHVMERNLHPPGALYIGLRKYGDGAFRVTDKAISKILFGGIGGFVENYGGGVREPHPFQQTIQGHLDLLHPAYVAAIITPAAFQPGELTVSAVLQKFPALIEAVLPYGVREIGKKAQHLFDNWGDVAKQIGIEVLKSIIKEQVKKKVIEFLVKKIGAKVIPLVNVASALYDAFAGEEERMQVRHAVACIMLHVKGTSREDTHIAAKILAKILVDKFEQAIMQALTRKAAELGGRALTYRKRGAVDPEAGKATQRSQHHSDTDDRNSPKNLHDALADQPSNPAPPAGRPIDAARGTGNRGIDPQNRGLDLQAVQKGLQQGLDIADKLKAAQAQAHAQGQSHPHGTEDKPRPTTSDAPGAADHAKGDPGAKRGQAKKKSQKEEDEDDLETVTAKEQKKGRSKDKDHDEDEPDIAARGTGNRGTTDKGDADDAAKKPAKKKADKHRKRGRKIALIHTLRQRWGAQATVILNAIARRDELRGAWTSVAPNLYAHHLVPVTVLKSNEVAQAAAIGGYDFNGKINGRLLNQKEHAGGHTEYNAMITQEMDHFARDNPHYTPKQARDFLESRVGDWGRMYVKSLEYVQDTSDPGTAKR